MSDKLVDPAPLDVDAVPVVVAGTVLWAIALVVCLLALDDLRDAGRGWWPVACGWGVALGLIGLRHTRRRRAAIARAEQDKPDAHPA